MPRQNRIMPTRYISNADGKGWLMVRYKNNSTYPPLPQYLKVVYKKTQDKRDYFIILEGRNSGRIASVSLKNGEVSYLIPNAPRKGAATVKFDIGTHQLWFGEKGPISAKTTKDNPVPTGKHDLEIPYEAHPLGRSYENESIYAKTWFRIGHDGDRFLHPGRFSSGCITVTDIQVWSEIYAYLITSRKADGKSVGVIEIINSKNENESNVQ